MKELNEWIRHQRKGKGRSLVSIAKDFRVSRNTLMKIIRTGILGKKTTKKLKLIAKITGMDYNVLLEYDED